jgi:hypothetical protein
VFEELIPRLIHRILQKCALTFKKIMKMQKKSKNAEKF